MTPPCSAKLRHLALWFPQLPFDRLRTTRGISGTPERPLVIIHAAKGAQRIQAADPHAAALGLNPGLALADARARVPALIAIDADPPADLARLIWLADRCFLVTPTVALDPPDGLLLEISGSAHLFGGEDRLADRLARRFHARGMHVRHAFAASADAACALARFDPDGDGEEAARIARLPLMALKLPPATLTALDRAGLKTVGAVAALPAAALAARFGQQAVTILAGMTGALPRLRPLHRQSRPIRMEARLPEPILTSAAALAVLQGLAEQAMRRLARRGLGGRAFEAQFHRSDGMQQSLFAETGAPMRDPALLMRLLHERIEAVGDPLDPGFGYDRLCLYVHHAELLELAQPDLDGRAEASEQLGQLIDRLGARLGAQQLRRLRPHDSHIPEQAQLALPAADQLRPILWQKPLPGEPPTRPLHLFDPPQPIRVIAEVPDGPPRRFRWRRALHDVHLAEGPERIAASWWRHKSGKALTRDYYRVEDARGRRFWLFRHGLHSEIPQPRWYLHGLFA